MEKLNKTILVTGATGHQGGAVSRHLLQHGWNVRALTRHPDTAASKELRNLGAQVVAGDFENPASLDTALSGVYGVFSVQQPWEYGAEGELHQGKALVDAAKRAGTVAHFVYSSICGSDKNTGISYFESKNQIEKYLRESGLGFTIVRPVYFMENFLTPVRVNEVYNGTLSLALDPEMAIELIAVDDVGAFVALAFNNPDEYAGQTIDLAGDEITGPQIAELLGNAIGRPVQYKALDVSEMEKTGSVNTMLFDWLNTHGFPANIRVVRKMMPNVKTFADWVHASGVWHRAAA